jgi:alpha/beta superfamily hydrolase
MKIPANTEPFLWGAAAGAIVLAIGGFSWGGWVTGGTAQQRADARGEQAMVASLAPICVAQFRKDPKAKASLVVLKETDSWKQAGYVSSGGWATMPGSTAEPNSEVAAACAETLTKLAL